MREYQLATFEELFSEKFELVMPLPLELFLTLAPQIAGRDQHIVRDGIVSGKIFAPEHPLWGTLVPALCVLNHPRHRLIFTDEYSCVCNNT